MKLLSGKVYRLRNGTIFGPLSPVDVGGDVSFYTNGMTEHTWHPDTGCETSGYEHLDIVAEVYPTPAILQFNSDIT